MKRKVGGNGARLSHHRPHSFMFATGIENSYPTMTGRTARPACRRDGEVPPLRALARRLRPRQELGIEYLRYGPPYYRDASRPRPVRLGFRRRDLRANCAASA